MKKGSTKAENVLTKYIVSKFLPHLAQSRWPHERSIAKKLVKKYPDKKFWETLTPYPKLQSLSWFLKFQAYYLSDHSLVYKTTEEPPAKDYNFQKEKIGEDFKVDKKPKNTLDFFD